MSCYLAHLLGLHKLSPLIPVRLCLLWHRSSGSIPITLKLNRVLLLAPALRALTALHVDKRNRSLNSIPPTVPALSIDDYRIPVLVDIVVPHTAMLATLSLATGTLASPLLLFVSN